MGPARALEEREKFKRNAFFMYFKGFSRSIWAHKGPYGLIWARMGPYGPMDPKNQENYVKDRLTRGL